MTDETTPKSTPRAQPTAAMLTIGDEILSGRIQDANAHHLAGVLNEIGVALCEIRVVSDDPAQITPAVAALSGAYDLVFTSGGIGPTHDDRTADAVAAAFGRPIDVRNDAKAILTQFYGAEEVTDARLRMARIPEGARLIDNPVSRAPGFILENVHVMAGVPIIFREMLAGLRPMLKGGAPTLSWSLRAPVREGDLALPLAEVAVAHPAVSVGCYPFYRGGMGSTLVLRGQDRVALSAAADAARAMLQGMTDDIAETSPA